MDFVLQAAFDVISILISAGALLYAALAFRTSKQAIKAARDSDITALKVKAQDCISDAERSMLSLQEACLQTRQKWDRHNARQFPKFGVNFGGSMLGEPEDTRHIREIECKGLKMLEELLSLTPMPDALAPSDLHQFVARAQSTTTQIERLKLRLDGPKPAQH